VTNYALIAQEAPAEAPAAQEPRQPDMFGLLLPMLLVLAVFYFIMIRPSQKKQKEAQRKREEMLKNLTKSDHVVTIGGLHGIVASATDDEVVIKVDEKGDVRLRFSRDAIARVVTEEAPGGAKVEEKK
jgi:preprotein translocase subunit YajC